jgi:hypothetical protein
MCNTRVYRASHAGAVVRRKAHPPPLTPSLAPNKRRPCRGRRSARDQVPSAIIVIAEQNKKTKTCMHAWHVCQHSVCSTPWCDGEIAPKQENSRRMRGSRSRLRSAQPSPIGIVGNRFVHSSIGGVSMAKRECDRPPRPRRGGGSVSVTCYSLGWAGSGGQAVGA